MTSIEIPPDWENLTFSAMAGVVLVIGAPDTGKTTFARYLCGRLMEHHPRVSFLDGDMGQATLGPPTTMTLALARAPGKSWPPHGPRFRTFVGNVSPRGHMLPTVVGAHKLVQRGRESGVSAIVYDTTGLVAAEQGGGALKRALVDLLAPEVVIGLERSGELEHLLVPLRCSARTRAVDRSVSGAVQRRDVAARRAHRAKQFRQAFEGSRPIEIDWSGRAVIPGPSFAHHQLVALEDAQGFVVGLGIVTGREQDRQRVELYTPVDGLDGVDTFHLGDVRVDPETFRDEPL